MDSLSDRCCNCRSNAYTEYSGVLWLTSKGRGHTSKIERIRLLGAGFWRHCRRWDGSIDWGSLGWGGHRGELGMIYLGGLQIKYVCSLAPSGRSHLVSRPLSVKSILVGSRPTSFAGNILHMDTNLGFWRRTLILKSLEQSSSLELPIIPKVPYLGLHSCILTAPLCDTAPILYK